MTRPRPVPVFVLGIQRSGTTWIANLLAAHPEIAAVTAETHNGVHESVFFSHFARSFGAWQDEEARWRFLRAFVSSDYFRLTGLDEDFAVSIRADNYAGFFRAVMDAHATRQGRWIWLEKSPHHTLLADELARDFPDAVFVCVLRQSLALLRSRLWAFGRMPPRQPRRAAAILRACGSNAFHQRYLTDFCARTPSAFLVNYEDLAEDPAKALAPIGETLGIDIPRNLAPRFAANSSFHSRTDRERALTGVDRLLARAAMKAVRLTPYRMLAMLQKQIAARRPPRFPHWVWTGQPQGELGT